MTRTMLGIALAAAIAAGGCISFEQGSPTAPGSTGVAALLGNWASANPLPSPDTCSDFRWNVTEQTATSARGSFSATCAGDLRVEGTASGTLSGDVIAWNAAATASLPGLGSCAITLQGTAELGVDSIRIPYQGDICVARVSGVEILNRR